MADRRFSWFQFDAPPELAEEVKAIQAAIDPRHVAKGGLEEDPHVTVLYGLYANRPEHVIGSLQGCKPVTWSTSKLTIFQNKKWDVLKLSVHSIELIELHNKLKKRVRNYQTFPDYHPHVTIGFIEKGYAKDYAALPVAPLQMVSDRLILHSKDRRRFELPLGNAPLVPSASEPPSLF